MRRPNLYKFIYGYCIERLGMRPYNHGWIKGDCPFCGGTDKLGINLYRDQTNCFKCGGHGRPLEAIKEIEGHPTVNDTIRFLTSNEQFESYEYKEPKEPINETERDEYFRLPDGYRILSEGNSVLAKSARSYIKRRGLNIKRLIKQGWGYGSSGDTYGYLIIPFKRRGHLIYYNARLFLGSGPRYRNPNKDASGGIGKSNIFYNWDALDLYDQVFLCEGAINAETLGEKAISSGGKSISSFQVNELIKSPVKRVAICLDRDALLYAFRVASWLIDFKSVKIIIFPEGKDINDLGKKETMKLVYNAKYLTRQDMNKLRNEYLGKKDLGNSINQ